MKVTVELKARQIHNPPPKVKEVKKEIEKKKE